MVGQSLGALGHPVRVELVHGVDDPRVEELSPVVDEPRVDGLMGQCMRERVLEVGEEPGFPEEFSGLKGFESMAQSILRLFGDKPEEREWDILADRSGLLEQALVLRGEPVDTRGQHSPHRVRDLNGGRGPG